MSNYYDVKQFVVPDSLKTSMNSVLNKKLGTTSVNYDPRTWAANVGAMVPLPVRTASGSIAHFEDGADDVPLKSLTAQILPLQEGTGDPSPSNPRPISGTSVLNVEQMRKNLFDVVGGQILNAYFGSTLTSYAVTRTVYVKCSPNTTYTVSKTAGQRFAFGYTKELPAIGVSVFGGVADNTASSITITTGADAKYLVAYVFNGNSDTGTADEMLASVQIELGSTATTYEAYKSETYTVNLGRTVYGGSAEVIGGSGTARPYYESYNGETLVGPWICSQCAYPDTPPIGSQVVDLGGTPTDFTFEGEEINSYLGVNNLHTDSGEVLDVEYRADMILGG